MTPTSSAATELTSLSKLLHLAHHRNKNQHRLSKWYKSFSQLRQQVSKLLSEVEALDTAVSFSSNKESKYVTSAREKVEVRVGFWEERLFERWYLAFSNLTADNQYASLGLMLLGCLARARSVVRPYRKISGGEEDEAQQNPEVSREAVEDLGEVVKREEYSTISDEGKLVAEKGHREERSKQVTKTKKSSKRKDQDLEMENSAKKKEIKPTSSKPPKKKKKKGDAFDDMFSGLM